MRQPRFRGKHACGTPAGSGQSCPTTPSPAALQMFESTSQNVGGKKSGCIWPIVGSRGQTSSRKFPIIRRSLRIDMDAFVSRASFDGKRMVIHIQGGKGRVDRDAMLSAKLLKALREHCATCGENPAYGCFQATAGTVLVSRSIPKHLATPASKRPSARAAGLLARIGGLTST